MMYDEICQLTEEQTDSAGASSLLSRSYNEFGASRSAPIFPQRFTKRPLVQQLVFGSVVVEKRGR